MKKTRRKITVIVDARTANCTSLRGVYDSQIGVMLDPETARPFDVARTILTGTGTPGTAGWPAIEHLEKNTVAYVVGAPDDQEARRTIKLARDRALVVYRYADGSKRRRWADA